MTEVQIEAPAARRLSGLGSSRLILIGRVLALTWAFVLIRGTLELGLSVGSVQPLALAAILLVAACARRSTRTVVALGYVVMFLAFLLLRPIADETAIPVHYDYPIFADQIMFLGSLPVVWLQDLFYVPGRVSPLDLLLAGVYVTYFFAPHLAALVVWRTRPWMFPKAVVAISVTFMLGLLLYFAVPTAPPWLASETGDIDADVVRIMPELVAQLDGSTYDEASDAVGRNDVAAMPSLHTALTCTVALIMASYGRRWRWVGITYVALMGTALVYLGEHYVIDEIAGIALAVGVWQLVSHHKMFAGLSAREEEDDVALASGEGRAA